MLAEVRFLVFLDFPFRDAALFAGLEEPFVTQPACRAAPFRMPDSKGYVAVGCNQSKLSFDVEAFNPVYDATFRRPEHDFVDKNEKVGLFPVVFVFDFFARHFILYAKGLFRLYCFWRGARESHPAS